MVGYYMKLFHILSKLMSVQFDVFLTVHHSIDLSKYQLSAHSLNIQQYKFHYTPQHVSSSTLLIIRRTNCITTASAYRG